MSTVLVFTRLKEDEEMLLEKAGLLGHDLSFSWKHCGGLLSGPLMSHNVS